MFTSVLVANRGEIAVRVMRTLRELGIRSVAVYSDADADAVHVHAADAAVRIGPAPAAQSYLDIDAVIAAALTSGAEAIHPGYGFLSENPEFARACAAAGITFIGPGVRALEVMADKIRAKQQVAASGVPVVPGISDAALDDAALAAAALSVGFPLLLKPSAGGGGKGMQLVREAAELPEAIAAARRVARNAFGDDTLLVERFISEPRHIEVQVLADDSGAVVHLGERECSLQRRHQKVIEEAPSALIDAATRERLGAAAVAAARSVDYRGAGTVEFLVSASAPDTFYFIEMNTRLQVEHPVSELVTGIDIVAAQLRIAAGEPLGFGQDDVRLSGHAVEARVYAESPERGFLPETGTVIRYEEPRGAGVRIDSGIRQGSVITADYDPMIAKVIARGEDRSQAIQRLDDALAATIVLGVETNLRFLRGLLADERVRSGALDTELIDRMPPPAGLTPSRSLLAAVAARIADEDALEPGAASELWRRRSGWRLGVRAPRVLSFELADGSVVDVTADAAAADAMQLARSGDSVWVHSGADAHLLTLLGREARLQRSLAAVKRAEGSVDPEVRSPMPGSVVALHAGDGEPVALGQAVASIEAMKMEHPVTAPVDGILRLHVGLGDQVQRGTLLATVEIPIPAPAATPDPTTTTTAPSEKDATS
ncbi:biotin carboxylase N-terminal domain-containing protein [Rathayibacter sp. YIM 133350]|uniref:acetyl/propionyl/methylcrotonyl-CoA carboxylase subunit alpha n=1 Tax=Rathayibacter sp. YIM 133350 TaxID=3131992 RepID=UPI00307CEA7F